MKLRPEAKLDPYTEALRTLPPEQDRTVLEPTPAVISKRVTVALRGDILLKYQAKTIKEMDTANVIFVVKSRRIGLTWGIGAKAVLTAAAQKQAGGMDVFYMGYEKEMAREFIDVCGMWAKAFGMVASATEEFVFEDDDRPEKSIKAFRIQFASGFEIVALPSKPRAFRGKQGLVILDEAAFMDDVQETIDAAMALLMWGGAVIVISTHYGTDNPFNKMVEAIQADPTKGKVITITFADAIADGLYERVKLVSPKNKPILPKEQWIADIRNKYGAAAEQELDCIPTQGGLPWINPADLDACEHDDAGKPELFALGAAFTGYDIAIRRDGQIIWTFEEVGNVLWLRDRWEETGKTFLEQETEFGRHMTKYRVVKAGVDQTGMGEPVVERLQRLHGSSRVTGTVFNVTSRLELAIIFRVRFEQRTIRIPKGDPKLRADLLALKRAGPEGKALMEGRLHPDRFWAGALACKAADGRRAKYAYEAARDTANDDDPFGLGNHDGGMTRHGMTQGGGAW